MRHRKNQKNGEKISQLSLGCMRFPHRSLGIDLAKSTELVQKAVEGGINYLDTAYIYPGIESALGKILTGDLREKVNLATKMPLFLIRSEKDFDKYFEQQLQRLKTDFIDYYLMHMLTDKESFLRLQKMGIEEWIAKEKDKKRIRNIGFSFHGKRNSFKELIDAYPWEFCMIQYNYLDENYQAGTEGLKYASSKGIPVIAMEPLRGGMLASNLPDAAQAVFDSVVEGRSPAEWGLRWVMNHPEVLTVLSGMSDMPQLEENLRIANEMENGSLTKKEDQAYTKVVEILQAKIKVNCTGCGYCMPCPVNVDIPMCFNRYNDGILEESRLSAIASHMAESGMLPSKSRFASQCKKCGKCEKHCPQEIEIMKELENAAKYLEPFWVKPLSKIAKVFTVGRQK